MSDLISRQQAIDALDEIRHALWEIDIPSPTVPEYVEHHEQVQSVWKLLDKKQKELYAVPSVQPERKNGKWIRHDEIKNVYGGICIECSECGEKYVVQHILDEKYCRNCGADMRGEQDE